MCQKTLLISCVFFHSLENIHLFAYVVYSYMQQDASKAQALKEKVIVIDCRNQNEWDRGHVNVGNVLHIPLPQLENSPKLAKIQKDTPITVNATPNSIHLEF